MPTFSLKEQSIDEGIERSLLASDSTIATIFFLSTSPDTIVVWPVAADVKLASVLDQFASIFLRERSPAFAEADIEYWIGDHYNRSALSSSQGETPWITESLISQEQRLREPLELLRLTCDGVCIELTFNDRSHDIDRAAVAAVDFDATALSRFLVQFHSNRVARDNQAGLEKAFQKILASPYLSGMNS